MSIFTKQFLLAAAERGIKTVAQTAAALIVAAGRGRRREDRAPRCALG